MDSSLRFAFDDQNVIRGKNDLAALVDDLAPLDDPAGPRALRIVFLGGDGDAGADRIADMDRADESQTVVTVREGDRVDQGGGEPDTDREDHRAVGNALTAGERFGKLRVHVMGEEITRVPGMDHEVRFRDRASARQPHMALFVVLVIDRLLVILIFQWKRSDRRCRARARLIGGLHQGHGPPCVLDGPYEFIILAAGMALQIGHAVGEGIGEPGTFKRHLNPVGTSGWANPQLVRLATRVVEIDAEFDIGGTPRPTDAEFTGLEPPPEIVVVIDGKPQRTASP